LYKKIKIKIFFTPISLVTEKARIKAESKQKQITPIPIKTYNLNFSGKKYYQYQKT
jgi:hypothetical protein